VVKLRAEVPENAFTAGILGSQRTGNGIVIDSRGLILTIGYLVTEATDVWLTNADGGTRRSPLAYDQVTGFGLVMRWREPTSRPFRSECRAHRSGDKAFAVSSPEFAEPQPVEISPGANSPAPGKYLLDNAIFATPAHPHGQAPP